jgi:hypothetical protein
MVCSYFSAAFISTLLAMSDAVSLDEVEHLQQEIEAAVREPDPVLANLLITRCHYLLSQALQRALGPGAGANFHSWAVWGSRKAGVTIRQEDLDDARRDGTIVGGIVGALVGIGCGWLLRFPLWLEPGAAVLGAVCGIAVGRLIISRSRRRSASLVLAGNRTVLEDIGLQTVRFLRWLAQAAPAQPADAAAFLAPLQPGAVGQQNQELLRQASPNTTGPGWQAARPTKSRPPTWATASRCGTSTCASNPTFRGPCRSSSGAA